jgi:hypothetical protein
MGNLPKESPVLLSQLSPDKCFLIVTVKAISCHLSWTKLNSQHSDRRQITEETTLLNEHRQKELHRLGVHPTEALEFAVKELDIGILIETLMGLVPGLDLAVGADEDDDDQ